MAFTGAATAGETVDAGVGETAGATTGEDGADDIGVAAGDGAADARDAIKVFVAKQIVSAIALKAWRYRIIG